MSKPLARDALLKYAWRNLGIRQFVLDRRFDALEREWSTLVPQMTARPASRSRILIVPPDPELLTASTGDQAMIGAIVSYWRKALPEATFDVAVASDQAAREAERLGMTPIAALHKELSLADALARLADRNIGTVVAMGADVLDGSYNVAFSGRQLMLADLLSRTGATVCVTGFSVSKAFKPRMAKLFDACDPAIRINLRDPVSFERFKSACRRDANLVADVAFLLEPRDSVVTGRLAGWIEEQQSSRRTVVGVNCHPLLLELEKRGQISRFVAGFADTLASLASQRDVAFMMIDHDSRGTSSDALCLEPLMEKLRTRVSEDRIIFPRERLAADEIKALVGKLDAVISGRMHLMIAALGAGTPVFGIEYKGKMEGLLRYFGVPADALCTAEDFLGANDGPMASLLGFIDRLAGERERIRQVKPTIHATALRNFEEPG